MFRKKKVLAFSLALILAAGIIAGCAARKSAGYGNAVTTEAADGDFALADNRSIGTDASYEESTADGIVGTGYSGDTETKIADILVQRKVIRNAEIYMNVNDFYKAYENLGIMLKGIGYVSDSNIHRDYYYYGNERRSRVTGELTIRIDARYFDEKLTDIKGLGEVTDDRIYSTDVTDQYFDTEGRLKILKTEFDFLEDYMRTLTDPEDVFKTRSRMTELQTEIEKLTGALKKWDNLVEQSTIYLKMTEKYPEEMTKKEEDTYWGRVAGAFTGSVAGVVDALGELLIFIVEAIPVLVVLGIFAWIVYRVARKISEKRNSHKLLTGTERTAKAGPGSGIKNEDTENPV